MKLLSVLMTVFILTTFTGCGLIVINDPNGNESNTSERDTGISVPPESESETISLITNMPETNRPVKPVENANTRAAADKYLNALPERDFNNLAVMIISTEITSLVPQNAETYIYNTRIERNQDVEKKYNTKIVGIENDYNTIYTNTYNAVYSGEYYTDILGIPSNSIGQFYSKGLLMNLNMLPFIDYSEPYYESSAVEQMSAGSGTYGLVGDFNKNMDYYYVVYFNKTLIRELGLANPYDLVYDDNWTIDKYRELALAASQSGEVYGHGASVTADSYIDMFFSASGENYMDTGIGIVPTPSYNNNRTVNVVSQIRNMLYNDNSVFDGTYTSDGVLTAFYNGNLLFYGDRVNAMGWLLDMEDDWGIVPLPKLDSSQDYYSTVVHESMPVICVPVGISSIDNTGLALQALNAASYGYINENYYDTLQKNVVRDSDTLNMLDYINGEDNKGRLAFDFAHMFGEAYSYIADGTYKAIRSAVTNNYTVSSLNDRHYNNIVSRNTTAFK